MVFAQDNAFGQGNVAAVEAVLGGAGCQRRARCSCAEDATEFTPFAQQILDADPDLVFVAWAGDTTGAMWQALSQQRVFDAGAGHHRSRRRRDATAPTARPPSRSASCNHYFGGAADNEVNQAMIDDLEEADGTEADLFSPDGFVAGQMIVPRGRRGRRDDVDAMIDALEGWEFDGPKGAMTVRAEDHALHPADVPGAGWSPTATRSCPSSSRRWTPRRSRRPGGLTR